MKSIDEIVQGIEEDFSMFEEWVDKYAYIIELGHGLPIIDQKYKDEDHLIRGCQSQVWLAAEKDEEGNVIFTADSDAIITKGIIALLVSVLSGQKAKDIASADLSFIDRIGLSSHLSPTRANGLSEMIRQMRYYAAAYASQE
ncbi:MAG: SufE family protein [Flavobacteriales bacterium]|jgi:cysteine desulfuration protein SufE|nr:SufE family protein [Flavobacteriales bacterium]MBQ2421702.1 SufE family protein [Flavobacteriales bacterium]MBQ5815071.1 SufE family protein [Flavobacteriales bacterium]